MIIPRYFRALSFLFCFTALAQDQFTQHRHNFIAHSIGTGALAGILSALIAEYYQVNESFDTLAQCGIASGTLFCLLDYKSVRQDAYQQAFLNSGIEACDTTLLMRLFNLLIPKLKFQPQLQNVLIQNKTITVQLSAGEDMVGEVGKQFRPLSHNVAAEFAQKSAHLLPTSQKITALTTSALMYASCNALCFIASHWLMRKMLKLIKKQNKTKYR